MMKKILKVRSFSQSFTSSLSTLSPRCKLSTLASGGKKRIPFYPSPSTSPSSSGPLMFSSPAASSSSSSAAALASSRRCFSTKKNWQQNGTPEIIIGGTILSLLLIDTLVQQYNDSAASISRRAVIQELDMAIQSDQRRDLKKNIDNFKITTEKNKSSDEEMIMSTTSHPLIDVNGKEYKTLYKCQIMKIPKYFDGTKSLKNIEVNDVVHVIQEYVGPDTNYHLCKIHKKTEGSRNHDRVKEAKKLNNNNGNSNDQEGHEHRAMVTRLENTYEYGWFPVSCLKKLQ